MFRTADVHIDDIRVKKEEDYDVDAVDDIEGVKSSDNEDGSDGGSSGGGSDENDDGENSNLDDDMGISDSEENSIG